MIPLSYLVSQKPVLPTPAPHSLAPALSGCGQDPHIRNPSVVSRLRDEQGSKAPEDKLRTVPQSRNLLSHAKATRTDLVGQIG